MSDFEAYEVFYSRVEAPYSPRQRSGYQVVYHSPALDLVSVREIEDHVRCFEATQVGRRLQYFHLSSGSVGLAVSQQIEPVNPQITDRAGRPGPFIAHCLVVEPQAFEMMGHNPFMLFDLDDVFVSDVEEMIEIRKTARSICSISAPTLEWEPNDYGFDMSEWDKANFGRLWDLAGDATDITKNHRTVAVQSEDESAVEALLKMWMIHLSIEARWPCTFNTFAEGCEPPAGAYWLIRTLRRAKQSSAIRIHLERRTVDYETPQAHAEMRELSEKLFTQMREAQGLED